MKYMPRMFSKKKATKHSLMCHYLLVRRKEVEELQHSSCHPPSEALVWTFQRYGVQSSQALSK